MKEQYKNILRSSLIIGGTALVWNSLFDFNNFLFSRFAFSEKIHWIFLPAAFRVIFILLFQGRGAAGLILGAYLTQPHDSLSDLPYEILLSISSGLAPLVGVAFCQQFFKINDELSGLTGWHIIALSTASAAANAFILNGIQQAMGRQAASISSIGAVFFGDMIGAAIVITAISLALSAGLSFMKRSR